MSTDVSSFTIQLGAEVCGLVTSVRSVARQLVANARVCLVNLYIPCLGSAISGLCMPVASELSLHFLPLIHMSTPYHHPYCAP